ACAHTTQINLNHPHIISAQPSPVHPAHTGRLHFNGDGKPEFAAMDSADNTVTIYLGNGDGTFVPTGAIAKDRSVMDGTFEG
ncbi:hypothetical protein HDF16_005256, partial [Granulicella aggregans]